MVVVVVVDSPVGEDLLLALDLVVVHHPQRDVDVDEVPLLLCSTPGLQESTRV